MSATATLYRGLLASVTLVASAHAQSFINLDFDAAQFVLPPPGSVYEADWSVAAPAWSHGPGQDAGFVAVPNPLPPLPGLTASYTLLDPASARSEPIPARLRWPCTAAAGWHAIPTPSPAPSSSNGCKPAMRPCARPTQTMPTRS